MAHTTERGIFSPLSYRVKLTFRQIKLIYANLTRDKGNDPRPLDEILSSYNTGELQIPCVQLQCISFDQPLYTALVSNRKSEMK
jgi:hypothetical protein